MKTLLSSLLLFSSISIFSQSCLPEGVTFSRQSQVDSFRILYPGCAVIEGDVSVFLASNFLNIDSLSHVQNIKGNLVMSGMPTSNDTIDPLHIFPNLIEIGGDLNFTWLGNFSEINGLESVFHIGGQVHFYNVLPMRSLNILTKLESIGEAFKMQYCDAPKYDFLPQLKTIGGDMYLEGHNDTLLGFNSLHYVGGDFVLWELWNLSSLSTFPNLEFVKGKFRLVRTLNASNYSGFSKLKAVGDDLTVYETFIDTLTAFEALDSIGGYLNVSNNDSLRVFSGLDQVRYIKKGIMLKQNVSMKEFVFPSLVDTMLLNIEIEENLSLTTLSGFNNLKGIGGSVMISANPMFRQINCFPQLRNISKNFFISENPRLTSLNGLDNLKAIQGNFEIIGNDSLQLIQLGSLESIFTDLLVENNALLSDFTGFNSLAYVKNLRIEDNKNLKHLNGFESLKTILLNLEIRNNDSLIDFAGFGGVSLKNLNKFIIEGNPSLESFDGLSNIEYIQSPTIQNNNSLMSLEGFTKLNKVGVLKLLDNTSLTSLDGLESLLRIVNHLHIINNPQLRDLSGIQHAFIESHNFSSITIKHNASLSACAVESICTYFLNSNHQTIDSNAVGCNSVPEAEAQCLLNSTKEIIETFGVYPNPVSNELFSSTQIQEGEFKLYDQTGNSVLQGYWNGTLQVSNLPQGIYTLLLQTDYTTYSSRFLKY